MGVAGRDVALEVSDEVERLSQAPSRAIGVVGVAAGGGVGGLEVRGPVWRRGGTARLRPRVVRRAGSGVEGRALELSGAEKAEPISERVSERTCMRIEGAR